MNVFVIKKYSFNNHSTEFSKKYIWKINIKQFHLISHRTIHSYCNSNILTLKWRFQKNENTIPALFAYLFNFTITIIVFVEGEFSHILIRIFLSFIIILFDYDILSLWLVFLPYFIAILILSAKISYSRYNENLKKLINLHRV